MTQNVMLRVRTVATLLLVSLLAISVISVFIAQQWLIKVILLVFAVERVYLLQRLRSSTR